MPISLRIKNKSFFEKVYRKYNKRKFIHPDPLEFVYKYNLPQDREVAGFIASSLAYGNVKQILKSVSYVLNVLGPSPADFLLRTKSDRILQAFCLFKHRFTTGHEIADFLINIRKILKEDGSIEKYFLKGYNPSSINLENAIYSLARRFNATPTPTLMPNPDKKSPFKRLNLFLRWMIRKDAVDPGVWKKISPSKLIIPLDTHMFQIARKLGITTRKRPDMKTAIEITDFFRKVSPDDPVKYDFALTRTGINKKLCVELHF